MILLSFFVAYGAVQMMVAWICSGRRRKCKDIQTYRILALKDCQDRVEGLVRVMEWENIYDPLIVVDLGSEDETPQILEKLERELDFLQVMSPDEYREYNRKILNVGVG